MSARPKASRTDRRASRRHQHVGLGVRELPGDLLHADIHGFTVIPQDAQARLLEAARFMDDNECDELLPASRGAAGRTTKEILKAMKSGDARFAAAARKKFGPAPE